MQNYDNRRRTVVGTSNIYPNMNSFDPPDRQTFNSALAGTLTRSLQTMLTHTSSERGRSAVPLITNSAGISPFPIKVLVKIGGIEIG